ncbi:MAG: hypothetical protein OEM01_05490 [Desulfobulbaceae bacterium]|nr:hypothetical protein [Desulfobulbaceae bacterium]
MDVIKIRYCFDLKRERLEIFDIEIDAQTLELLNRPRHELPEWTRLEVHQCSHCPFTPDTHSHCPVAVCLSQVIGRFANVVSHNEIHLEVITDERTVSQETTAQKGISSLIGLLIVASGCPHAAYFKPMARFHLPLASEDETFYRATGMYLLAQYFLRREGKDHELGLEGLKEIYRNLHLLNTMIAGRIRIATDTDSSVNAVILLDMISSLVPLIMDEQLDKIRHLFDTYFPDTPSY